MTDSVVSNILFTTLLIIPTMDPKEFLDKLIEASSSKKFHWQLKSEPLTGESEKALRITKNLFDDEELFNSIDNELNHLDSRSVIAQGMLLLSQSLISDVKDYVGDTLDTSKIAIGFLPIGLFEAFVSNKSFDKIPLNGYTICISQGLYYSLQILVKCLILEQLSDEYTHLKKSGRQDYKAALKLYFNPKALNQKDLFFNGFTVEEQAQLGTHQHLISSMILKFIVFHEIAHITHNDFQTLESHNIQLFDIVKPSNSPSPRDSYKNFQAEFKADEFAICKICDVASSNVGVWANFSSVYLFLLFLSNIESLTNNRNTTHPSAKSRAENLVNFMKKRYGIDTEGQKNLLWLEDANKRWFNEYLAS